MIFIVLGYSLIVSKQCVSASGHNTPCFLIRYITLFPKGKSSKKSHEKNFFFRLDKTLLSGDCKKLFTWAIFPWGEPARRAAAPRKKHKGVFRKRFMRKYRHPEIIERIEGIEQFDSVDSVDFVESINPPADLPPSLRLAPSATRRAGRPRSQSLHPRPNPNRNRSRNPPPPPAT